MRNKRSDIATGYLLHSVSTFTKIKAYSKSISAFFYPIFCILSFVFITKTSVKMNLFANKFILLVNKKHFYINYLIKTNDKLDLFTNNFILLVNKMSFNLFLLIEISLKLVFKHVFGSYYTYYTHLPTEHIANLKGCYQSAHPRP